MTSAEIILKYQKASNRLILLDYDGTLTTIVELPDQALPPKELFGILVKLDEDPGTKVVIITGRGYRDAESMFGHIPVTIIAEHGAMIRENNDWRPSVPYNGSWKKAVISLLDSFTAKNPDSFVEEKKYAIAWHYRNMDRVSGYILSRELLRILPEKISDLKILDGKKVVEIMSCHTGKGQAVVSLLDKASYDYVLCIGDDVTDEEMFRILVEDDRCCTIKVGPGQTIAKSRLPEVADVLFLLQQL
jgi:trehalose 6-phosphate synthase/phosphatase